MAAEGRVALYGGKRNGSASHSNKVAAVVVYQFKT